MEAVELPASVNRSKLIVFLVTLGVEAAIGLVAVVHGGSNEGTLVAVLTNITGLAGMFIGFTSAHDSRVRTELVRAKTAEFAIAATGDLPRQAAQK